MTTVKQKIKQLISGKWEPRKCLFPYPEGYCAFHTGTKEAIDFGNTKEAAQAICNKLNDQP